MKEELVLQPEELFFLGCVMEAKTIDYAYIAAMGEIGRSYDRVRSRCMTDLTRKGILRQRFGGAVTVAPGIAALLQPLFFSRQEALLSVVTLLPERTEQTLRFHYTAEAATAAELKDGALHLYSLPDRKPDSLMAFLALPQAAPKAQPVHEPTAVRRIITARGRREAVLFEQDNTLYTLEQGVPETISAEAAAGLLLGILRGE